LTCGRTVIPIEVIDKGIQTINPRYRTLIAESTRGDKTSPKEVMILGTDRIPISPYR
jgi:hypothetical protein